MDGQFHFHAGLGDPRALRPNLYSSKSANRVTADPEKKSHKHKSSHHHDRHNGHDRHSSSKRHAAKEAMQSAIQIQPPTSFGDLLRQARGSRDTSPSHSRSQSAAPGQRKEMGNEKEKGVVGLAIPPRRPIRPEDVELEEKRVEAREQDLRATLQSLSDQSLKTSRRLDDTYYSILEKVSVLRQTIGTLHELSGLTRELHDNFEKDTTELVEDVTGQVEAFEGFKKQQEQVSGLEERIKAGKERADSLTARLERAKERVDAQAEAEAQWQARNTHRVRIFWSIVGIIAAFLFILVVFHPFSPTHTPDQQKTALDSASKDALLHANIPHVAKDAILDPTWSETPEMLDTSSARPLLKDDERLRGFDEL